MCIKIMKFYILGDCGHNTNEFSNIVDKIEKNINDDDNIILLGDNFYLEGVDSVDDPLWKFWETNLTKYNKYVIIGNHDYQKNPYAQIEYNKNKWSMPYWYYTHKYNDIQIWFLDTCQIVPNGNLEMPNDSGYISIKCIEKMHNADINTLISNQLSWLDNSIEKSNAKYKIVMGHYPLKTYGYHNNKNIDNLRHYLMPILKKHNIQLYIGGHDHNLQHIILEDDIFKLHNIVCGNSSSTGHNGKFKSTHYFYNDTCCYLTLEIKNNQIIVNGYDINNMMMQVII